MIRSNLILPTIENYGKNMTCRIDLFFGKNSGKR